jgi:hypothetical protein
MLAQLNAAAICCPLSSVRLEAQRLIDGRGPGRRSQHRLRSIQSVVIGVKCDARHVEHHASF